MAPFARKVQRLRLMIVQLLHAVCLERSSQCRGQGTIGRRMLCHLRPELLDMDNSLTIFAP